MPEPIEAARDLIRELELRLRELIGRAAAAGQYDDVSELADLTNQIGALVPVTAGSGDPGDLGEGAEVRPTTSSRRPDRSAPGRKTTSRASSYPLFCRHGDFLVKVGWSRSAKREYEHRVPKHGVDALVKHLAARRANQFPLTVDVMLQALRDDKDARILGYQVYVVVAWLRQEGLLATNGRNGYTLRKPNAISVESIVESAWGQLPIHP